MTPIEDLNRMAVQGLLADVDRVLALTDLEAVQRTAKSWMTRLPTPRKTISTWPDVADRLC